ncbi:MAG TPA: DNA-processing protein DprA [Candidatus Saccharimonadales bacterium]|nr:DNA-processing protein DprA [Candidatus Saccharimonadales bacterium]
MQRITIPPDLKRIASPPKQLFHAGANLAELLKRPRLAIIGSRSVTAYGRQVTLQLAGQLAEQGIVIISGLALGVDGLAHQACLDAGGLTIAVLPGPLDDIVPSTHQPLSDRILAQGGALISEYDSGEFPAKTNFIARNRLVAGLSQAVLITEAGEKSGSLHTARFALEQGKDVLAVPGNITSVVSIGTNNLIKAGATVVTSYLDVLHALKLTDHQTKAHQVRGRNAHEQTVLDLLLQGISDADELLVGSQLSATEFNQVLTMLEIGGKVRSLGANHWGLV